MQTIQFIPMVSHTPHHICFIIVPFCHKYKWPNLRPDFLFLSGSIIGEYSEVSIVWLRRDFLSQLCFQNSYLNLVFLEAFFLKIIFDVSYSASYHWAWAHVLLVLSLCQKFQKSRSEVKWEAQRERSVRSNRLQKERNLPFICIYTSKGECVCEDMGVEGDEPVCQNGSNVSNHNVLKVQRSRHGAVFC